MPFPAGSNCDVGMGSSSERKPEGGVVLWSQQALTGARGAESQGKDTS